LDTHQYNTSDAIRGLFTVSRSRTEAEKHTVLNRAMTTWNSLPTHLLKLAIKPDFKKMDKRTPYGKMGTVKRHRQFYIFCNLNNIIYCIMYVAGLVEVLTSVHRAGDISCF
jgi:hypothetical protein